MVQLEIQGVQKLDVVHRFGNAKRFLGTVLEEVGEKLLWRRKKREREVGEKLRRRKKRESAAETERSV